MARPSLLLFAVLTSGLWPRTASAQVNVEVLRSDLKKSGFGAKIDSFIDTYLGNTQGTTLGATALVGLSSGRHLGYFNASGDYSHLAQETQVQKAFAHARYNFRLTSWVWGELFGQVESDRFRRIALRTLVGAGPRFELVNTDSVGVYYGAAYMLERTRLKQGTEPIPNRPAVAHRFSNYASVGINLDGDRVVFSETLYYQPRFDDFGDWRFFSLSGLDFEITGPLSAGIEATFRFEDPTPTSVRRADFTLKNTLGLEF